jgi:hypothetical protein
MSIEARRLSLLVSKRRPVLKYNAPGALDCLSVGTGIGFGPVAPVLSGFLVFPMAPLFREVPEAPRPPAGAPGGSLIQYSCFRFIAAVTVGAK